MYNLTFVDKMNHFKYLLIFLFIFYKEVTSKQCVPVDQCECAFDDGSGTVSLKGIRLNADGTPEFSVYDGDYTYLYNPCKGFDYLDKSDLAILQRSNGYYFDLGVQSRESWNYTDSGGLSVKYIAADTQRTSRVTLLCNSELPVHLFYFTGELVITEYDFILEGPCACPGKCNANGIIPTPTDPPPEEKLEWEVVRFDFVSMIFHDLILMFFIVTSSLVVVYVMKKQFVCCKKPGIVTSQAKSDTGVENVNYSS